MSENKNSSRSSRDGFGRVDAAALILEHLPDIVTLCNRLFQHRSDAQDATHEAVIAILRDFPAYRAEGPIRHWLLKVALNAARSHRRKLSRTSGREQALKDDIVIHTSPARPSAEREAREALRSAVAGLPDPLRDPVVLHYFHRLTQVEIGRLLGCSQKTVHMRLRKGLLQLQRGLAGQQLLGAVVPATALANATLDTVSAAQVAAVQQSIAAHVAAPTIATGSVSTAQTLACSTASSTLVGGGVAMNMKLLVGGLVAAFVCFMSGALLSDQLPWSSSEGGTRNGSALGGASHGTALSSSGDRAAAGGATSSGRASASDDVRSLRQQLARRDRTIAELQDALKRRGSRGADGVAVEGNFPEDEPEKPTPDQLRDQRWDRIEKLLGRMVPVMKKMDEDGPQQEPLPVAMIEDLKKITPAQYAEIVAFDKDETRPEMLEPVRVVLTQAFLHAPNATKVRDAFMGRLMDRVQAKKYGDVFRQQMLHRLSFAKPPHVDMYASLIAPLDDTLRRRFADLALLRLGRDQTEPHQKDAARYLARSTDHRASESLMTAFHREKVQPGVRAFILESLAVRATTDARVLQFLRDAEPVEQHHDIRDRLSAALGELGY